VTLVLLVLLGDWRAGLVVATTIPLSLLFAVTVMNGLGLSGNLMSLGAIDFGLIVDGAVIIVENALSAHVGALSRRQRRTYNRRAPAGRLRCDDEVRAASVFGEAIIAIVYLPLLRSPHRRQAVSAHGHHRAVALLERFSLAHGVPV